MRSFALWAGLLVGLLLPVTAWADATIQTFNDDTTIVVPGNWSFMEDMDGWVVVPDEELGFSSSAYLLMADPIYNLPLQDPYGQCAALFGYLTATMEVEDRSPATSAPLANSDSMLYVVDGWYPATEDSAAQHVMAILIVDGDGSESTYFVSGETDTEIDDLLFLAGMIHESSNMTDAERGGFDLSTYSFTHAADYEDE